MSVENRIVASIDGNFLCDEDGVRFYKNWKYLEIQIGDKVSCERSEDGFYRRIWVNGELKIKNNFNELYGIN